MADVTEHPDLASRTLGGSVVSANDELFAPRQNLVLPAAPVFAPDDFGHTGKVYDGWETRRRREPGHDWAIVRLGVPGVIHGFVVDTAFFTGNYPPQVSIEAASVEGYPSAEALESVGWVPLVPSTTCHGDTANLYEVADPHRWTHVRINIFPDGGVARLRVHGEPVADPRLWPTTLDLVALENGGRLLDTSDAFYSSPRNLILPGRARIMGDGWENARRRGTGNDWVRFALAARGVPTLLEVDTSYFIGNAPGEVRLSAADAAAGPVEEPAAWWDLVPRTPVQVDTRHRYVIEAGRPATHLRLDVYPDGGLARLRCHGELTSDERTAALERFAALLPPQHHRF